MTERLYLLDSNICIYILKDSASRPAQQLQAQPLGGVGISSVSYAEVMLGIERSAMGRPSYAPALFTQLQVLAFDRRAADVYATLPFRRGRFDRLIAAHALALGAILVTNDENGFSDIPQLRLENWAA